MASDSKSRRASGQPARRNPQQQRGSWRDLLAMDSEQSARLLLMGGVALILLVALAFIAVGYWVSVVQPRNRTVLEVDGVSVSYSDMKRRMSYELVQNPVYRQVPQALPQAGQEAIIEERALLAYAQSDLGLEISEEDFQNRMRTRVGVGPDATQTAFAEALARRLEQTGLREAEYRQVVRAELIREKSREKFQAELPENVTQAKAEVIAVASAEEAREAAGRIEAGEEWSAVAADVSLEPNVAETGGVYDYGVEDSFNPVYDDYVFSAEVGEISEPLASNDAMQYYIVRVVDRSEQPVREEQEQQLVSSRYSEWLENAREKMSIDTSGFDNETQTELAVAVLRDAPPVPQPQQQQPIQVQPSDEQQPPADAEGESGNPPVDDQPVGPGAGDDQ